MVVEMIHEIADEDDMRLISKTTDILTQHLDDRWSMTMMDMDIADKEHKCSAELKNKNSEYCNNFKRFSTTLNSIYPILLIVSTSPLLCNKKFKHLIIKSAL